MPAFTPGQILTAAALNSMADDILKSLSFFAIVSDFGAVNDFVVLPGSTGTGTDNSSSFDEAMATGKPLWIPPGNFYLASAATRSAFSRYPSYGPGSVWGQTNVGKTKIGKLVSVGTTRSHELDSVGGLLLGGESGHGIRQWMGHQNWMQWQPTKPGAPAQIQVYPNVCCGLATPESPNALRATHGIFDTNLMTVGDHFGYGSDVYKIAGFSSATLMTVTKFDGSSPAFVTNPANVQTFYHAYESATGTCNTSGTAVTYVSGEQYPFGVSGDHMYAIINGTKYNVTQGPESTNANSLTLATSAGVQTNVSIQFRRCWGYFAYVSLLRLQGLGGGIETNCGLYLNIRNEAVLFNSGYGTSYYGDFRINGRKLFLGQGDGTGGTEYVEIGGDYMKAGGSLVPTVGKFNKFANWQYVENVDQLTDPGSTYMFGWTAALTRQTGYKQVVPGYFVGEASGGTGTIWGVATEVWSGTRTTPATASNTLVSIEASCVSQYSNQSDRVVGVDAVFKNRPDNAIYGGVSGGIGSNRYNLNSYAFWVTSQPRSTAGEYCGWTRGIMFDTNSLDRDINSKAVAVDMSLLNPAVADMLKFPDGTILNSGGQQTWSTVSLSAGFAQYGAGTPVGYRKEPNNVIRLKGALANAGATNAGVAFTLPAGYRPVQTSLFPGYGSSFVEIRADGSVRPTWGVDPGIITLDGITFTTV